MSQSSSPPPIDERALTRALEAAPNLDCGTGGRLARLPAKEWRNDAPSSLRFHWITAERVRYQIDAGPQISETFAKVESFFEMYPDLGIRPLALLHLAGLDVAVYEHFEGQTMEQALASGTLTPQDANRLLDRLIYRLDATALPTTAEDLGRELALLRQDVLSHPAWGTLDIEFFEQAAFPCLHAALSSVPLLKRWTNGDFIARNVILGASGDDMRLIDCEFAAFTPLAAADYFRFAEFSEVPDGVLEHVRARLTGPDRLWEVHFCLDQARKLARIRSPQALAYDSECLLLRLLQAMQDQSSPVRPPTCLYRSRDDYDDLNRHARKLQARYEELHRHSENLQQKYAVLHKHCEALQKHYEALDRQAREWRETSDTHAKEAQDAAAARDDCAQRLASTEQERAALAQRIHRLPRPWLWFSNR
jgi:hypothetical protein